jgi:hypothetical protein
MSQLWHQGFFWNGMYLVETQLVFGSKQNVLTFDRLEEMVETCAVIETGFLKDLVHRTLDILPFVTTASSILGRGGHGQLFFESAITMPQLAGITSAIAIPQLFKEMLICNRNAAIPQSQFFPKSSTSSPQLERFTCAMFGIFMAMGSDRFVKKNCR